MRTGFKVTTITYPRSPTPHYRTLVSPIIATGPDVGRWPSG